MHLYIAALWCHVTNTTHTVPKPQLLQRQVVMETYQMSFSTLKPIIKAVRLRRSSLLPKEAYCRKCKYYPLSQKTAKSQEKKKKTKIMNGT